MCLNKAKIIQTENDIVCYKVLIKTISGNLVSPYYPICWEVGKEQVDYRNLNWWFETELGEYYYKDNFIPDNEEDTLNINEGVFHTFKNKDDATAIANTLLLNSYTSGSAVYECVIPAESEFKAEGKFLVSNGGYVDAYGSNRLKLIKKIAQVNGKENCIKSFNYFI